MFKCLLGGDAAKDEPLAIESEQQIEEKLLKNDVVKNDTIKDTLKKNNSAAYSELPSTRKEGLTILYQDRATLIRKKEVKCSLLFKRLDEFFLKPCLIRDYEKRQVRIPTLAKNSTFLCCGAC